jgi:hypothetical protein
MPGSMKCQPNCKCGKHNKKRGGNKYPPRSDQPCLVAEKGNICGAPVKNLRLGLCSKHYQRLWRTGTTDAYSVRVGRRPDPRSLDEQNIPCICGCLQRAHFFGNKSRASKWCMTEGCNCQMFHATDQANWMKYFKSLRLLYFNSHVMDWAVCDNCGERVRIGLWYEPETIKRALLHARRDCRKRDKRPVRPLSELALTGPNGVG